jgi:hypothetical protein
MTTNYPRPSVGEFYTKVAKPREEPLEFHAQRQKQGLLGNLVCKQSPVASCPLRHFVKMFGWPKVATVLLKMP